MLRMPLDTTRVLYALGLFVRTSYDVIFSSQTASATAPIGITTQAHDARRLRTLDQRALPLNGADTAVLSETPDSWTAIMDATDGRGADAEAVEVNRQLDNREAFGRAVLTP